MAAQGNHIPWFQPRYKTPIASTTPRGLDFIGVQQEMIQIRPRVTPKIRADTEFYMRSSTVHLASPGLRLP